MANGKNMANREVCNAIIKNYQTKKPLLYVDYANATTTEVTGESVYAYGGMGHPRRVTFNGEKGGTIAFEFQVQPFQLFAIMSGAEIEKTASFYKRAEVVAKAGGVLDLPEEALGSVVNIYAENDDCGTDLGTSAVISGKEVTLETAEEGKKYFVYYETKVTGDTVQKISITGKTFPKALTIDADTIYKAEDDTIIPMRLRVYKCQPQSQFTLTHSNSGDPGTITLTCDLMEDENGNMIDMIAIEEE